MAEPLELFYFVLPAPDLEKCLGVSTSSCSIYIYMYSMLIYECQWFKFITFNSSARC